MGSRPQIKVLPTIPKWIHEKKKDSIMEHSIHLSSVASTTPNLRHSVPLRTPCGKSENNKSTTVRHQEVNLQIGAFQPWSWG